MLIPLLLVLIARDYLELQLVMPVVFKHAINLQWCKCLAVNTGWIAKLQGPGVRGLYGELGERTRLLYIPRTVAITAIQTGSVCTRGGQ